MAKKSKLVKAVLKLHRPAVRYLKAAGVSFSKPWPSIYEVARKLRELHPELLAAPSKRHAIVEFGEAHKDKLRGHWFGPRKPQVKRLTKAEFDAFYRTKEWRQLRFKALLKYGRACMCCNATNKPLHVDHVKPRSKYPELELELSNLQILCEDCNMGKGGWSEADFRETEDAPNDFEEMDAAFRATIGPLN